MSFLSSILGGIGTAASTVGSTLGKGFSGLMGGGTPSVAGASSTGVGTGATTSGLVSPTSTFGGGWGTLTNMAGSTLLKNIKLGGGETQKGVSLGPNPAVPGYKKKYASSAPKLPTSGGTSISLDTLKQFGEEWAKAKMQREAAEVYGIQEANRMKYRGGEEQYINPDQISWDEYIRRYYENDWSNL